MFRANLGAPTQSAISGRAKREDKVAGDTANFHYTDNLSRSIEQLGRVVVDMVPRIYDTPRQARIVGEDGSHEFVQVDPSMNQPVKKQGKKVVAINPGVGAYDVRVKTGPAYTTLREEQAEQLAHIMQAAPALTPILADLWVGSQDMPEGDKLRKRLAAMLPPQIQEMESEEGEDIPPEVLAKLQAKDQQIAELSHALETAHAEHMQLEQEHKAGLQGIAMKESATSQREADKHAKAADVERMRASAQIQVAREGNDVALQLQSMKDQTAHLTTEIQAIATLLSKMIQPPQQMQSEAAKEAP
jgi:hypothetical protein